MSYLEQFVAVVNAANKIAVLDHGFVRLCNLAGPTRRMHQLFDANDLDPANTARMSFDQFNSERTDEMEHKLCAYLMKNRHTTPIEMIEIWIEMKMPIFVARQFVRHRTATINEVSARYVQLGPQWYVPKPSDVTVKAESNKQGRSDKEHPLADWFCKTLDMNCLKSYELYERALKHGIPNELARCFLHVNHYTHWIWKQDLHNMMHFLSLRDHSHAQREAKAYAVAIDALLRRQLPNLMKLYDEHRRQA